MSLLDIDQRGVCHPPIVGALRDEASSRCEFESQDAGAALCRSDTVAGVATTGSSSWEGFSKIVQLAARYAASAGEPNARSIQHSAKTTRHRANVVAGAGTGILGDEESYLVAVRGHFVAKSASRPGLARGAVAPAPTGSVLTLVIDALSWQVTDVGIHDNYPDLPALGAVTTDYCA